MTKITKDVAIRIFLSELSIRALARQHQVDRSTIQMIKKRKNWGWATAELGEPVRSPGYNVGLEK